MPAPSRRTAVFAAGTTVAAVILALLAAAPWIAPYGPAAQDLAHRLAAPSAAHWLGTDHLGRDELTRLLYGGRFSVAVAALTLIASAVVGVGLGVVAARAGGAVDELIMRAVDLVIAFPDVVVALFLVALLGPGYVTLWLALTAVGWTPFARVMRGLAMEINTRDYVRAAEILGCSRRFITLRHLLPNALRPVAAIAFLRFGHKLVTVGGLSYLGLGVQPPASDWGAMLFDSRRYMERSPLLVLLPGLAIFVTALAVSAVGQGLDLDRASARPAGLVVRAWRWLRRPA